jgi:TRAP-type C4-dicarboxylate transport system substrate-binding protein
MRTASRLVTLVAAAAAGVATLGGTALAENVELRIATLAPDGSKWMQALEKAAAEIASETGNRVTMKYYAGGKQGEERDYVRKIKLGQLDGAAVTAVGLALIDESIRVLELPMMFETEAELDYVADKMWPYFQAKFEKKGFKLTDRGQVGWIHFLSTNKVESLADLKNQKVWLYGDDTLVSATYRKVGINGVSLGVAEVDSALAAGKINACYGSPLAAVALQWYTKVKYMTSMPMSYAIGATVVSLDALKKIGADDQKLMLKIAKSHGKKLRKAISKENENAQKTMTRKGVTLVNTPVATIDDFRKQAEEVWKDLVGKIYTQAELDMVLKYRDEYRAKKTTTTGAAAAGTK